MEVSNELETVSEDSMNLGGMSPSQSTNRPARRRVYQTRRNSRACDACRARKTKCDAPGIGIHGPCTSCASASLVCKFTDSSDGKKKIGPVRRLRMLETTVGELNEKLKVAEAKLQSPSLPITPTYSPRTRSPGSATSPISRRLSSSSNNESLFIAPTSNVGFMDSVQGYMEGLGYDTSPLDIWGPNDARTPSTGIPPPYAESLQIKDLRALLPIRTNGEKLLNIFRRGLTRHMPVMCWSIICDKFERAYEAPISADDRSLVTSIFCVLMVVNAYASICSDDSEVFEVPNYSSKRGWYFLEFAKNFHNLSLPTQSPSDAEVLLIMALYLEAVALPYPLRLTVEYLARVCKNLGFNRKLAYGKFKLRAIELEHRYRIFWTTYILERKLALQFGTTPLFDEDDIDIEEPGNNDMSDLVNSDLKHAPVTSGSLRLMHSLIATSHWVKPIARLSPQTDDIESRINEIELELEIVEGGFPGDILNWQSSSPLEPDLMDSAILPMATRLSLYRHFTDASLNSSLRTRCFIQSVEVAKVTVHLLRRVTKYPDWEKTFRLRQSSLTYHHIFKISIILLLAAAIFPKPLDTSAELRVCIEILQAVAPARPSALHGLQILDKVAEILKQKPILECFQNSINNIPVTMPYDGINRSMTVPVGVTSFSTGVIQATTAPCMATGMVAHTPRWVGTGPYIPADGISVDPSTIPSVTSNYKFPNLTGSTLLTNENTAWLDQVDPSSWVFVQNVLQPGEIQ